jgi:hypothetical protein
MRVWYVIIVSHIGYLGVFIEVIWNYQPIFFIILRIYNFYSNFICISSVLNNKLENLFATIIIVIAYLASWATVAFLIGSDDE